MARITISINAADQATDQDLVTLDIALTLTIADLKGFVEAETRLPQDSQHFYLNGQALRDDTLTLEAVGIKDGELLAMMVNPRGTQQSTQARRTRPGVSNNPEPQDSSRIEQIRGQIMADPAQRAALASQNPDLAAVIDNPDKFRDTWMAMLEERDQQQRERENQIRLLNEDPFNADAQKRIEEIIRQEKIQENLQYAYENNPAVFAQVTMLYVYVLVNGHPIKAFVDSGAQSTIMSPDCAEACGIRYLIDERYSGIARGVGTAKILGKVHNAKIQVGDAELDCAFTVMEGKDVDLLFGLDMLKRHQACIDLVNNKLRFPHTEVAFLPENEIPKREEEKMLTEPTVKGPNGTEIGAKSGTIRPEGTAQAARESLAKAKSSGEPISQADSVRSAPQPSSTAAGGSSGSSRAHSEADIAQLINLGFSRDEAISALDATGGNVEYAAGMLFAQ